MTTIQPSVGGRVRALAKALALPKTSAKNESLQEPAWDLKTTGSIGSSFAPFWLRSRRALSMIPLQDVLGLGSEARMNLPGTVSGNWKWRFRPKALTSEIKARLKEMTLAYDR